MQIDGQAIDEASRAARAAQLREDSPTSAPRPRLRFAVMCSGTTFPRWQAQCIESLLAVPGVELAALIIDAGEPAPTARAGLARRLVGKQLLWNAYNRLFVASRLRSSDPVDLHARLAATPRVECVVEQRGKYSQYFAAADVARIQEFGLDFIVRFGFNIIRGDVLGAARYGVWSYHHDDLDKYRGRPACFWEIFFGDPVTGVTLQRLTEGIDNGVVLQRAWFKTVAKSYARNRDAAFAGSVGLPARVCRDLLAGEGAYVDAAPSKTTAPVYRAPDNVQTLSFAARIVRNRIADAAAWLTRHDQWNIGIVDAPIARFLEPDFVPAVRWLPPPPVGTIAADPFAIERDGVVSILYEELDDRTRKGRIVATQLGADDAFTAAREVIASPVHLSYPYLVEDGGEVYCIPEMAQSSSLTLFRAAGFPWRWEPVAVLLEGVRVIDASIFRHGDAWWMLGCTKGAGDSIELRGWHAPALAGPWQAHACNPLSIDVRGGRPGGTPFRHGGELYRPAQDLSTTYGGRIVIKHVRALTPTRFDETVASVVSPRPEWPFPAGLHTLSAVGQRTVIDAKRTVFSPREFWSQLAKLSGRAPSN